MTIRLVFFLFLFFLVVNGHSQEEVLPPLESLESLSPDQARLYEKAGIGFWRLPRLRSISDETLASIRKEGKFPSVVLDGLKDISDQQIELLSKADEVHLNGLTHLKKGHAKFLGRCREKVFLNGITEISPEDLIWFWSDPGELHLCGLKSFTRDQARNLGRYNSLTYLLDFCKFRSVRVFGRPDRWT